MSEGFRRAFGAGMRVATAAILTLGPCATALGDVKVTVSERHHIVQGTTPSGLVRSMNSNPVRGDHGNAYASIHPDFHLSIDTYERSGMCRAEVEIRLNLRLTLPKAANLGGMSKRTRSAWNSFTNFARQHEAHHQASYTSCARSFVAKAERMSNKQCFALQSDIRKAFNQMKRDCEAKQLAYDRAQAPVLARLSLFSMVRAERARR